MQKNRINSKIFNLLRIIARSFWRVFSLPFRAVRFVYRKIARIPLKQLILLSAIFIILIVTTLVVMVKVTSQPGFCVTCHYMEPYFASWEESAHKEVHCTECHFPPGLKGTVRGKFTAIAMVADYFTGVYRKSKPWAEISDQSCLRGGCHETKLLESQVSFKEGIIFDHTPHLTKDRRGKNLRCTSCHSQIVQGTHITVTEETCFLCHFKDQPENARMANCTLCHDAPVASDTGTVIFDHAEMVGREVDCRLCHGNMALGNGDVPQERCSYCHAEAGTLEQFSETDRLHKIHITEHKVECSHCHNTILHRSIARTGHIKPDCQACHIDRHTAQYSLFSGQGAVGVDPMPASMFHAGLGCKACHIILSPDWREHPGMATMTAGPASCTPCHEKAFFKLYKQAEPILRQHITSAEERINSIKLKSLNASIDSVIAVCSNNLELLIRGLPIHNLEYSDEILNEINRSLDILEGKKPIPRTLPDTTSERCQRCHYGQDEALVLYGEKGFSHSVHVHASKVGCATCHQEDKPHHGKLNKGAFCMDCHHSSAAVSCEPCHTSQRNLITAEGIFAGYEADIMHEAGLTCRDCYEVKGSTVKRPLAETCKECHEPGYWDNLEELRAGIPKRLIELEQTLLKLPPSPERNRRYDIIKSLIADGTAGAHNIIVTWEALDSILVYCNTAVSSSDEK